MSRGAAERKNASKTRGRPFKAGNSGRPKGARNKATMAAEALLDGEAEGLTRRCIEMALEGDSTAMRLVMERIGPPRKDRPIRVTLPEIKAASDIVAASSALLHAVAAGEVTPNEAQTMAALIETHRRTLETQELEQRLAAVEDRQRGW